MLGFNAFRCASYQNFYNCSFDRLVTFFLQFHYHITKQPGALISFDSYVSILEPHSIYWPSVVFLGFSKIKEVNVFGLYLKCLTYFSKTSQNIDLLEKFICKISFMLICTHHYNIYTSVLLSENKLYCFLYILFMLRRLFKASS